METWLLLTLIVIAIKAAIGFHFPWEKCGCCGKRWGDHSNREKGQ